MAKIEKQAHRKIENACYKTHSDLTKIVALQSYAFDNQSFAAVALYRIFYISPIPRDVLRNLNLYDVVSVCQHRVRHTRHSPPSGDDVHRRDGFKTRVSARS